MKQKRIKIIPFKTNDLKTFELCRKIRTNVFIVEQSVEEEEEFDAFEEESQHYLLMLDEFAIGTARWRATDKGVKLERFAILEEFRGNKYGEFLLKKVIEDAAQAGDYLYLHAQLKAVDFYARQGFMKIGPQFEECGIWHYKMELTINR